MTSLFFRRPNLDVSLASRSLCCRFPKGSSESGFTLFSQTLLIHKNPETVSRKNKKNLHLNLSCFLFKNIELKILAFDVWSSMFTFGVLVNDVLFVSVLALLWRVFLLHVPVISLEGSSAVFFNLTNRGSWVYWWYINTFSGPRLNSLTR